KNDYFLYHYASLKFDGSKLSGIAHDANQIGCLDVLPGKYYMMCSCDARYVSDEFWHGQIEVVSEVTINPKGSPSKPRQAIEATASVDKGRVNIDLKITNVGKGRLVQIADAIRLKSIRGVKVFQARDTEPVIKVIWLPMGDYFLYHYAGLDFDGSKLSGKTTD